VTTPLLSTPSSTAPHNGRMRRRGQHPQNCSSPHPTTFAPDKWPCIAPTPKTKPQIRRVQHRTIVPPSSEYTDQGLYTTGKTAFAVRQKICRALSIGRTAKAPLCRARTARRTAPITARCRSSLGARQRSACAVRRTTAHGKEAQARAPPVTRRTAGAELTVVSLCRAPLMKRTAQMYLCRLFPSGARQRLF
jgi:hypothetical protein